MIESTRALMASRSDSVSSRQCADPFHLAKERQKKIIIKIASSSKSLDNADKIDSNGYENKGKLVDWITEGETKEREKARDQRLARAISLCMIKIHFMFSLIYVTFDEDSLATATLESKSSPTYFVSYFLSHLFALFFHLTMLLFPAIFSLFDRLLAFSLLFFCLLLVLIGGLVTANSPYAE